MDGKTGLYVTVLLAASIASKGMAGAYEGYVSYINDYHPPSGRKRGSSVPRRGDGDGQREQ